MDDYTSLSPSSSLIERMLERLERKASPQGLSVMAEELQWMGLTSVTLEKLMRAVDVELRKPNPQVVVISEGVIWFRERMVPAGWSLFCKAMLPCFYREYPPAISWEQLDLPENILPRPQKHEIESNHE